MNGLENLAYKSLMDWCAEARAHKADPIGRSCGVLTLMDDTIDGRVTVVCNYYPLNGRNEYSLAVRSDDGWVIREYDSVASRACRRVAMQIVHKLADESLRDQYREAEGGN